MARSTGINTDPLDKYQEKCSTQEAVGSYNQVQELTHQIRSMQTEIDSLKAELLSLYRRIHRTD